MADTNTRGQLVSLVGDEYTPKDHSAPHAQVWCQSYNHIFVFGMKKLTKKSTIKISIDIHEDFDSWM